MPKRKCSFTKKLQEEFSFCKRGATDEDVVCTLCSSNFSVAHGGRADIADHTKTQKHKSAVARRSSKGNLCNWFPNRVAGRDDLERAAKEALFAFHTVKHDHSFRSMDCTSKIIKKLWDSKFSAARTKSEAIVTDVLSCHALEEMSLQLKSVSFISVSVDASNHRDVKLLPILIRYFTAEQGVSVKLIDLHDIPGETSALITERLMSSLTQFQLTGKVVALSADNTNANFGGAARQGERNVFALAKGFLQRPGLIGLGCPAHILHNAMQTASDCLPIDVEQIIVKIYGYFHIYTVRVTELKEFCEFVDVEYQRILGYSKTRWLALLPAVERVLKLYAALKSYFLSQAKCPTIIRCFFEDPVGEAWLFFVHSQAAAFCATNTAIQGQVTSAMEAQRLVQELRSKIISRRDEMFVGMETRRILRRLEEEGRTVASQFNNMAASFFQTCIEYIDRWDHSSGIVSFNWVLFQSAIEWTAVEASLEVLEGTVGKDVINGDVLFDEVSCVKAYATENVRSQWKDDKVSVADRWQEVFAHMSKNDIACPEMRKIIQFALCLPGTNAPVERVFSLMNNLWTSSKTQMLPETVKALLITKTNYNISCDEFYSQIVNNKPLLESVHSSKKYKWAKKDAVQAGGSGSGNAVVC